MAAGGVPMGGHKEVSWVEWFIGELDRSPTMQALFFVLVVVGRFALDRWERRRERNKHKMRRRIDHG